MLPDFKDFNYEEFLLRYRNFLLLIFLGIILVGVGIIFIRKDSNLTSTKIEVLNTTTETQTKGEIVVDIEGQVEKPGVYKLPQNSRVEDLLIVAGGVNENADRVWVEKSLNKAAKLTDGQKVYIPKAGEQSNVLSANNSSGYQTTSSNSELRGSGPININTASLSELDSLPGIGQVYGQNIIDHRPYSSVEELLSKGALKESVYKKIKDLVTY